MVYNYQPAASGPSQPAAPAVHHVYGGVGGSTSTAITTPGGIVVVGPGSNSGSSCDGCHHHHGRYGRHRDRCHRCHRHDEVDPTTFISQQTTIVTPGQQPTQQQYVGGFVPQQKEQQYIGGFVPQQPAYNPGAL